MKNITIIGAGSWGCALSRILADNGRNTNEKNNINFFNINNFIYTYC